MTTIFVPVALSENEAIALKSAAMVVFTSGPVRLPPDHPLFTGALAIEDAMVKAGAMEPLPRHSEDAGNVIPLPQRKEETG